MKLFVMPRMGLNTQIFLGFLTGIILGLFFGDMCGILTPLVSAFTNIWQITIIPMIILSLITGLGRLKRSEARVVAVKVGSVLLTFWALGILAFFAMQFSWPCP